MTPIRLFPALALVLATPALAEPDFAAAIRQKHAPRLGVAESLRNAEIMDRLRAASR